MNNIGLLSTNDRIIKLWNVKYRETKEVFRGCEVVWDAASFGQDYKINHQLLLPELEIVREGYEGALRKEFKNCHHYNINSLSVSADGETFMSADDLRVNMWHLDNDILAYNVVDLKPTVLEDL